MGHYDTRSLPIYQYLHSKKAPNYVVADRFFQGAFGGSFLNHQYLIAARAPVDTSGGTFGGAAHSVIDSNGMPKSNPPLYTAGAGVVDGQLTQVCADGSPTDFALACGNYAVNTVQPASPPFGGGAKIPLIDDTVYPNIGDRLSAAGSAGPGTRAAGRTPRPATPARCSSTTTSRSTTSRPTRPASPDARTCKDEKQFIEAARHGTLPTVSFVKPYGAENEHPGYASEPDGSDHLVDLLRTIQKGPQAKHTLVVVTYDEFGGQWDHVSPPGTGSTVGAHDAFGPGTRIPALVISAAFTRSGVDHTVYDTTSIMASIERRLGLAPVSSRDAQVADPSPHRPCRSEASASAALTSPETFSRNQVVSSSQVPGPNAKSWNWYIASSAVSPTIRVGDDVEHVLEARVDPDGHLLPSSPHGLGDPRDGDVAPARSCRPRRTAGTPGSGFARSRPPGRARAAGRARRPASPPARPPASTAGSARASGSAPRKSGTS